jgi:hypothetical protein
MSKRDDGQEILNGIQEMKASKLVNSICAAFVQDAFTEKGDPRHMKLSQPPLAGSVGVSL